MEPHDLVVNLNPDVPLKVPLDQSSLTKWQRVEILKKKNLDRYETVAQNLQSLAEVEKKEMYEKLRKKKKLLHKVEENYKNER